MNTRRLTKKYKHKSRSRNKSRKTRRRGRRVLKGGVRSVRHSVIPSVRHSVIPSVRHSVIPSVRPSDSVRPSSSAGIYKPPKPSKLDFKCFYDKLMRTDMANLPYIIEGEKDAYICNTTLGHVQPSKAYLNMNGLKFVSYLCGKYRNGAEKEKKKIKDIVSLFDQCNMSQGVRSSDLAKIEGQVDIRYYECYEKLYNEVYKKLFPNGNSECFPVSTSAVTPQTLDGMIEGGNK